MTAKLLIQNSVALGGGITNLAQMTGREGAAFFDSDGQSMIELGHRCYNGEASQGTFRINLVELPTWYEDFPSAHWLLTLVEDSQTPDVWLSRGRVATDEGGRGTVKGEGELDWTITVDDGNSELRGQAFTEAWVRPVETDIQRLVALQLYTLNGSSSTATYHRDTCTVIVNTSHLAPNANTVTMPAKKYVAGTQPQDVIQDCADTAGKQYGVVIHHTGGSHLCLLYLVNDDHATYLSAAKISDQVADWVPTSTTVPVFEPHWEQGVGQIIEMQTVLSGMVGVWGASETSAFEELTNVRDNTDYWVEAYHDGDSTTQTQAANRTAGILAGRRNSHVTHRVSVILQPDQVHLITAGMSIDVKSAVTFERGDPQGDPDVYIRRRIAECRFEPRYDGRYWCHLDLERPPLRVAPGRGKAGPIPPVQSEPASGGSLLLPRLYPSNTTASASIDGSWASDDRVAGLARVATTTQGAGGGTTGASNGATVPGNWLMQQLKYTLTGTVVFTGGAVRAQAMGKMRHGLGIGASLGQSQMVVRLMDSSNALKAVLLDDYSPGSIDSAQWSNEGDGGPNPPIRNVMLPADASWSSPLGAQLAAGTGVATDYLLIEMGVLCFTYSGASGANYDGENDYTTNDLPDNDQTQTTPENAWVEFWSGSSGFIGTPAPPAATNSTGSIGTSPTYSSADHQHPAQVAGVTAITDEGEYFGVDNVEEALQQLGASIGIGSSYFNVRNYGATGDGATDDQTAINAAIAALNAAGGGVLYFSAGTYLSSGALTSITVPATVMGDGLTATTVTCSSATANLFTSASTTRAPSFRNLSIINTHATPTAGAGIRVSTGGNYGYYANLRLENWWVGIRHEDGSAWTIDHVTMNSIRKYAVHISNADEDEGDWAIDNSAFAAATHSPDAAIRIDSSGGGKITNVKINGSDPATGYNHGIDLPIAGSDATSILLVSNCSIENIRGDALHVSQAGTAFYSQIAMTNCQISLISNNSGKAVSIVAEDTGAIEHVTITGNLFATDGTARTPIALTKVYNADIRGNTLCENFEGQQPYTNSGSTGVIAYYPAAQVDYVEWTSPVSPTATAEASANTVVTANAFTFDGQSGWIIEFYCPNARPDLAAEAVLRVWLFEDGSSIGRLAVISADDVSAAVGANTPILVRRQLTPSAASHTYSVRATVSTGTGSMSSGAGGAGNVMPGYIRIVKA